MACNPAAISSGIAIPCNSVAQCSWACVCEHAGHKGYTNRSITNNIPNPAPVHTMDIVHPKNAVISGKIQNSATPISTPPLKGTILRASACTEVSHTPAAALSTAINVTNPSCEITTAQHRAVRANAPLRNVAVHSPSQRARRELLYATDKWFYPRLETICDDVLLTDMDNEVTSRRTFYGVVINGLMGLITAAIALPAAAYLLVKPNSSKKSQWIDAADVSQLKVGKPEEVTYRRTRVDGWRVMNEKTTAWVVKKDDATVVAFAPNCTNLACAYHYEDASNQFVCPCHASTFSIDGKVTGGPAPRPLDRYVSRVDGTKLLISSQIERSA